jgi:hypothetical protein
MSVSPLYMSKQSITELGFMLWLGAYAKISVSNVSFPIRSMLKVGVSFLRANFSLENSVKVTTCYNETESGFKHTQPVLNNGFVF